MYMYCVQSYSCKECTLWCKIFRFKSRTAYILIIQCFMIFRFSTIYKWIHVGIWDSTWANEADVGKCVLRYEGNYEAWWKFSNLQYFCQMIFGKCSIKMHTQFILIAQEKCVLGTFFFIFATVEKKRIIQLAITQYIEFGIGLSCKFVIIITFDL